MKTINWKVLYLTSAIIWVTSCFAQQPAGHMANLTLTTPKDAEVKIVTPSLDGKSPPSVQQTFLRAGEKQSVSVLITNDTADFHCDVANSKVSWTLTGEKYHITETSALALPDRFPRGCNIKIETDPAGAQIFFNKRQYYRNSNANVAQDPGTWEVVLSLGADYDDWKETKTLGPSDTWNIKVQFHKKQPEPKQ